jgi:GH24 family phage-related lysozyme (muramidase)
MNQWKWCLTDNSGKIIKGWYQDDKGTWYHLNNDTGILDTGWFKDKDNRWYYLDEQNGDLKTGWIQLKSIWFFLEIDSNGYMGECYVNRTAIIDSKEYSFDSNGHLIEDNTNDSLVSEDCISFVKGFEKFYSYKYDDGTGTITQGYGAVGNEIANWGDTITEEEASEELKTVINSNYAKPIKEDLDNKGVTLTQSQQDSIYSMAYNIGVSSLLNSTLYRYICNGGRDTSTIQSYFCMWSKATINGVSTTLQGLYKRRVAESNIFNYGTYDSTH